jgi:N-acetylglutamate synthase-like GNAT family acetyltransferase
MGIRKAKVEDWKAISELLNQLNYPDTQTFIKEKIEKLLIHPDEEILVYGR